jgi:hypothetical protein
MIDSIARNSRLLGARGHTLFLVVLLASTGASAQPGADRVAGIQLYPGSSSSNVGGQEEFLRGSGYKTAVCRHTADSLAKVVAFYSKDKQLALLGEPSKDNAGFATKAGASMSINSPWVNMKTMQFNDGTMICIVDRSAK